MIFPECRLPSAGMGDPAVKQPTCRPCCLKHRLKTGWAYCSFSHSFIHSLTFQNSYPDLYLLALV